MSRTRLRQACPIFPVRDLWVRSRALCVARLRRQRVFRRGGLLFSPSVTRLPSIPPANRPITPTAPAPSVAYLVVGDADQLAAEWAGEGIGGRTNPPVDIPWGMREGTHFDPDGNLLRFGSPLPHR